MLAATVSNTISHPSSAAPFSGCDHLCGHLRNYDDNASIARHGNTLLQNISTNKRFQTTVDFETFQRVLNRPGGFRDPGEPDEYCRGFQVFDKDMTGFIGVGQLKYILTNLGEKMTDEEVDELLKAVDTSSGQVNYTGKWHKTPPPSE